MSEVIRRIARPIRAYHGSPHDFDKFDAAHIGRGEGNQSYGHGLYFAGAEDTGKYYRDALRPRGKALERELGLRDKLREAEKAFSQAMFEPSRGIFTPESAQQYIEVIEQQLQAAQKQRPAYVYEVDIDVPEQSLLDYDQTFSGQSPEVQSVLRELMDAPGDYHLAPDQWRGHHFYNHAARHWGQQPGGTWIGDVAAAEALRSRGIPGVKYLDGLSRRRGGGSSNYVIFPGAEHNIRILRKYGMLAPVAAGAAGGQQDE